MTCELHVKIIFSWNPWNDHTATRVILPVAICSKYRLNEKFTYQVFWQKCEILYFTEIRGGLPDFVPNSDFENGFGHNSALVLQFILKIIADILPSQYASYRVLASLRCLTRWWDRYQIWFLALSIFHRNKKLQISQK